MTLAKFTNPKLTKPKRGHHLSKNYRGMDTSSARTKAYREASKECWWVYRYLMNNNPGTYY